jgi:arylsulfatase A-like enzyme
MQDLDLKPGEKRGIPLNRTLMPEYLRQLGYGTHLVGKWNVGYYSKKHTPTRRGFDSFYGFYNELIGYFDHRINVESDDRKVYFKKSLFYCIKMYLGLYNRGMAIILIVQL